MNRIRLSSCVGLVALIFVEALNAQTLTVHGDQIAVDGRGRFLIFASYFDAMRRANATCAPVRSAATCSPLDADFAFLGATNPAVPGRVDGIRILPNWWAGSSVLATDSLFDSSGAIRDSAHWSGSGTNPWDRFVAVLQAAKTYNLLVDVTFTIETIACSPSCPTTLANYQTGIAGVLTKLRTEHPVLYRRVFFDLQNEMSINLPGADLAARYSNAQALITALKPQNPLAIMTASVTNNPLPPTPSQAGANAVMYQLPIVAFHDPRTPGRWFMDTTIRDVVAGIRTGLGTVVKPIALDEPQKWADDPTPSHFTDAVKAAKKHGVALWTYHTETSQDLVSQTMLAKMGGSTGAEAAVISALRPAADSQPEWGIRSLARPRHPGGVEDAAATTPTAPTALWD